MKERGMTWIEVACDPPYFLALVPGSHVHLDDLGGGAHRIGDYAERYRGYMRGSEAADYMIDVGANIGLSAFPVASIPRRVVAFEPVADNVKAMRESAARNCFGSVTLVECAISAEVGEARIYVPLGRADNSSLGEDAANANVSSPEVHGTMVPTETIDHWFGEHDDEFCPGDAWLMKIDVQGYETAVLQGAREFIAACRPFARLQIEFEFDPTLTRMAGYATVALLELIHAGGLEVYDDGTHLAPDSYAEFCGRGATRDLLARFRPPGA
jgi:FkbM family methyltransferase